MNFPWSSRKPDPIFQRAETLLGSANILGISSYSKFANDLPFVNDIETEQWDWVFTIAGVFVAVTGLNAINLESHKKEKILEMVGHKLAAWKPDGLAGFEDCKTFFDRTYDSLARTDQYKSDDRFLASDSLGSWMAWNLLGHAPECEEETDLIRMAGSFVCHSFVGWWKTS